MRQYLLISAVFAVFIGCRKRDMIPPPPPPSPPVSAVLVKDIMLEHLPSPYYHFEYDASKKVSFVSFASDFTRYNVLYDGARISEMRNNILVNKDRLLYSYDDDGKVGLIKYADSTGIVYKTVELFYDGPRLIRLDRARRLGVTGFVMEKEVAMSYYADGNLKDITYHYPPFEGQTEATYTTHFEEYDNKINVDGFGLIHDEFFDHLFLLPGVQLQKNNPGKESRSGDGVNYAVDYTYTYNDKNAPLTRTGDFVYLNGTMTGQHLQLNSTFSYYQ